MKRNENGLSTETRKACQGHLWPFLRGRTRQSSPDPAKSRGKKKKEAMQKARDSESCCLPHPVTWKTWVLCKSKTNSLGLILLPRSTQRDQAQEHLQARQGNWWKISGFQPISFPLLGCRYSSLCSHNCSGTCFSSPINHYSLLREELGSYRNIRLAQLSNSKKGTSSSRLGEY